MLLSKLLFVPYSSLSEVRIPLWVVLTVSPYLQLVSPYHFTYLHFPQASGL